jgi:radical SAM superfamily enzyme YgiQ (UPF0313 family)
MVAAVERAKAELETTGGGLTAPGAILLVATYELGHQPLVLAAALAHLRAAGYDPVAVDTSVEELPDEAIRRAELVAISVPMHTALRLGVEVARRVRAVSPAAHVCFVGLYAGLNADHLLSAGHGDTVIAGEFEDPLLELARALDRPVPPVPSDLLVAGVGARSRAAAPVIARPMHLVPERGTLPPIRRYAGLERDGTVVPAGYVEATRGCHHTCRHCPITPVYGGRFTVVPREIVLADARAQIAAGARHLTFGDPDFFNGPEHSLRICRALHEEFPWLTFDATIKVEHLLQHRRRLPELAALGCLFVVTAVESLSERVLRRLAKGHTRVAVEEALGILDVAGIAMRPSLLPFTPWETIDGYLDLLGFFARHGLIEHVDPVQFSIRLLVPPGSALLDDPGDPGGASWCGPLDPERFTHVWTHPDPRMDLLHREVAAIVEDGVAVGEPSAATFARIWSAAHRRADLTDRPPPAPERQRCRPPRLTESWFC